MNKVTHKKVGDVVHITIYFLGECGHKRKTYIWDGYYLIDKAAPELGPVIRVVFNKGYINTRFMYADIGCEITQEDTFAEDYDVFNPTKNKFHNRNWIKPPKCLFSKKGILRGKVYFYKDFKLKLSALYRKDLKNGGKVCEFYTEVRYSLGENNAI